MGYTEKGYVGRAAGFFMDLVSLSQQQGSQIQHGWFMSCASLDVTPVVGDAGLCTCTSGLPDSDGPLRTNGLHQGMFIVTHKGEVVTALTSQQRDVCAQALRPWSVITY